MRETIYFGRRPCRLLAAFSLTLIALLSVVSAALADDTKLWAAIKNGELTASQIREVLIHLAQYAGYPRAAGLLGPTEKAIAEFSKQE